MKKLNLFFLLAICATLLFSCGSDDDEPNEPTARQNLTTGTWAISDTEVTFLPILGQAIPEDVQQTLNPITGIEGQTIVFNDNGTFVIGQGTNQQQGTWTLSEGDEKLVFDGLVNLEGEETDFIDAQTRTNLQTFNVNTLTEARLAIQNSTGIPIPAEVTQQLINVAIPVTATVQVEITFNKQ